MVKKKAIIIGAGPAGLTAAYELIERTEYKPIIFEMSNDIGGISKTVNYKGNRIDIGGHRFFSKSDRVMQWWQNILPIQGSGAKDEIELNISYHNKSKKIKLPENGPDPEFHDKVMLIRNRLSRIFYLRKFFSYPVTLSLSTVKNLGLVRMIKIGASYIWIRLFPLKKEQSLEDFFINRFGNVLYKTFFKDYTEKVWGTTCNQISAEWGAQRIKGLSISKAVWHAVKSIMAKSDGIEQKKIETSLIDQFMYPKFGPGQLWEVVAEKLKAEGCEIIFNKKADQFKYENGKISAVSLTDTNTGKTETVSGDIIFSTIPVKDLLLGMKGNVPENVLNTAANLQYRDFITVGLLLKELKIKNTTDSKTINNIVPDNWIYIQERDVKIGRLQIFNNWSPYMVSDPDTIWIGLEYFCNEGDELWNKKDDEFIQFAIEELVKIDIIEHDKVIDHTMIRMPKTYPSYFGAYKNFNMVRDFILTIENLHCLGRNGMHKYNNQDHSMLTAMVSVDNIVNGKKSKENIWEINTEEDYHETK
ncbi:MAG: NAD(P)/FAD-dependent oxidoreductase [Candidatus Latescibacteria bacterium]|nr:NAD(P)/FAD-dependent oxidoreductase [Candidatus Latescibacterota bacterium]